MTKWKIHGRPLLPWWAYIAYFLCALAIAIVSGFNVPAKSQTVKIDENALARAIAKALKDSGRNGDTELAHVNKREKKMLVAQGGSGTKNPKTGMSEFFDMGDAAAAAASGDFGGAAGAAAGATGGFGGAATSDSSTTGGFTDLGNLGVDMARGNYGAAALGATGTPGAGGLSAEGPSSNGLANLIDKTLTATKPSWAAPSSRLAYEAMDLLGGTVGRSLNDRFGGQYSGTGQVAQFDSSQMGGESRNDTTQALMNTQPGAQLAPSYMRPAAQETPANLGLQGLSDIQKRTLMATYGTQGAQSQYRTPEAMRAYGNLIARALIGDNNQVTGNETGTLPIEDQYLRQVFGIQKPNSASALLDALRPYWSQ